MKPPDPPIAGSGGAEGSRLRWLALQLVRWDPAPGVGRVGVRAALVVGAALLVLETTDNLPWALYATFGAFASSYGGRVPHRRRWRVQVLAGCSLSLAVACGAATAAAGRPVWLVVLVTAATAVVMSYVAGQQAWRPPGATFFVFAVAACAFTAPTTGWRGVGWATAVSGLTAAVGVVLGHVEFLVASRSGESFAERSAEPADDGVLDRSKLLDLALRNGAAVVLAGTVTAAAGLGQPYLAMVAAVVPLAVPSLSAQVVRGVQRGAGTVGGVLVAGGLLVAPLASWVHLVVIAALQGLSELFTTRNYGFAMLFITPLALLSSRLAVPRPVSVLLAERVVETLVGVGVGLSVAVIAARADGRGRRRHTSRLPD